MRVFARRESQHMKRVALILEARSRKNCVRGPGNQEDRRDMERTVRKQVLKLRRWARRLCMSRADVGAMLHVSPGTIARWEKDWCDSRLSNRPLGRPAGRSPVYMRNQLIELLHLLGPQTGVPTLRAYFPEMPRDEIKDMLQRYRRIYIREDSMDVYALKWKKAGSIWSMDFTRPPKPVDGIYRYILTVRDLASGNCLLWLPCEGETSSVARDALESLFKAHGSPLVIKSDNGSAFISGEISMLLAMYGVVHLLTPPYTPQYNGEVESGNGVLKIHAHYEAARHGRPGEWTCDDVAAARLKVNEVTRPCGHGGPNPKELWQSRKKISGKFRRCFLKTMSTWEREIRKELGYRPGEEIGRQKKATVRRRAVRRALVGHGLLELRRQGITIPISLKKLCII